MKKNKQELFEFLSTKIADFYRSHSKEVFVTQGQTVLTNKTTLQIPLCDHEEADTQVIVHVVNALKVGIVLT